MVKVFSSEVYARKGIGDLRMAIPLPKGRYLIRIYFAELFAPALEVGKRVFTIEYSNMVSFSWVYIVFTCLSIAWSRFWSRNLILWSAMALVLVESIHLKSEKKVMNRFT